MWAERISQISNISSNLFAKQCMTLETAPVLPSFYIQRSKNLNFHNANEEGIAAIIKRLEPDKDS